MLDVGAACRQFECREHYFGARMETYSLGQTSIMRSLPKSIGMLVALSIFAAIGVWLIHGGAVDTRGKGTILLGWLSMPLCGLGLAVVFFRLIFGSNTPVIFSQTGLFDKRSFEGEIPWSAVTRVSVFSIRKTSVIRLQLAPDGILLLKLTWSAKITRWMNKPFGLDGLYITSNDLDISFPELWNLTRMYVAEFCPDALDGQPR